MVFIQLVTTLGMVTSERAKVLQIIIYHIYPAVEIEGWQTLWMAVTFIHLFFRKGYLLFVTGAAMRAEKPISKAGKISAGVLLLCFQCIAYTAYWDVWAPSFVKTTADKRADF